MIKYANLLLVIVVLISCKQNEINLESSNVIKYFNEHRSGFRNDSFFQVNFTKTNNNQQYDIFDSTFEYYLSISKTIPYNNNIEFIICKKSKSSSIHIGIKEEKPLPKYEEENIEDVNLKNEIFGVLVSPNNIDYIEKNISVAFNLKSCINDFDGWKSFNDGGYSMQLKIGTDFFVWSSDYISKDCKIEIEKLWNSLNNDDMFNQLKKAK